MGTAILMTGDLADFPANCFSDATIVPSTAPLVGTGPAAVGVKKICLVGDEASAKVAAVSYFTPSFPTPGTASLRISALDPSQQSQVVTANNKAAILATGEFIVEMQVIAAASIPTTTGKTDDPRPLYTGKGTFKSQNTRAMADK